MFCRTKAGTLRLVYEGDEIILDSAGCELPDALAESIRTHVNVEVVEKVAFQGTPGDSVTIGEPKKVVARKRDSSE